LDIYIYTSINFTNFKIIDNVNLQLFIKAAYCFWFSASLPKFGYDIGWSSEVGRFVWFVSPASNISQWRSTCIFAAMDFIHVSVSSLHFSSSNFSLFPLFKTYNVLYVGDYHIIIYIQSREREKKSFNPFSIRSDIIFYQ